MSENDIRNCFQALKNKKSLTSDYYDIIYHLSTTKYSIKIVVRIKNSCFTASNIQEVQITFNYKLKNCGKPLVRMDGGTPQRANVLK